MVGLLSQVSSILLYPLRKANWRWAAINYMVDQINCTIDVDWTDAVDGQRRLATFSQFSYANTPNYRIIGPSSDATAGWFRAGFEHIIDQINCVTDIESAIIVGIALIKAGWRRAAFENVIDHPDSIAHIVGRVIVGITGQITTRSAEGLPETMAHAVNIGRSAPGSGLPGSTA